MTEWRMASQPAGRPTPTCRGERICRASRRTALAAHLEVNLRSTSPTANGRRPPPFFRQGRREAPHRCWMTACGDVLSEVAANPSQIGPWCKLFMLPKCVLVTPPRPFARSRHRSNGTRARCAVEDGQYRKALQSLTSMGLALPSSDVFNDMKARYPCVDPSTIPAAPLSLSLS